VLHTALVVAVPEAPEAVAAWMERASHSKPSNGVPPHITVLTPFMPADALDERVVMELRGLFARFAPFRFTLTRCARFPQALYVEPEPPEPFVALTRAVVARYPEYPPYEGVFDTVVPHLTVAEGPVNVLDAAQSGVEPHLPVAVRADEVVLLEEVEPDGARWRTHSRLPLGDG
jgi:2'-5' RNA ligase